MLKFTFENILGGDGSRQLQPGTGRVLFLPGDEENHAALGLQVLANLVFSLFSLVQVNC